MSRMKIVLIVGTLLGFAATASAQTYHVAHRWIIGGQGGWDYLTSDDAAQRLYIAHNTRVEVVNSQTGKVLGAITGLTKTHGVVLNPDGKTGYISDGGANKIVVFNRRSLGVVAKIPGGMNPDGMTFEPVTQTVWAFNGHSKNISILDTMSNKVLATVLLPGKPEFPNADGQGNVFVNLEDKGFIARVDAKTHAVTAVWPLTGCKSPSGMAIDRTRHRLFSVCDNQKMMIVDATTGIILGAAPIGNDPDAAGFDAKHDLAFSSNGDGTLTVVDAGKPDFPVVQTVKTADGARTMALDEKTGRIYLVASKRAAAAEAPAGSRPKRSYIPGTFEIIVVSR